jgi:hypothetical protein
MLDEWFKKAKTLESVLAAKAVSRNYYDRALLDKSAIYLEITLSHIFGFQWLRKLLSYLPLERYQIILPYPLRRFSTFTYHQYDDPIEDLRNEYTYGAYFGLHPVSRKGVLDTVFGMEYHYNIFEIPLVLLQWVTANIGRVLGWSAASPFAAVGYVCKRLYFMMKIALAEHQFQREFLKSQPLELAAKHYVDPNGNRVYLIQAFMNALAPCLTPRQMLESI